MNKNEYTIPTFNRVWEICYGAGVGISLIICLMSFTFFEFSHPIHIEIDHLAIEPDDSELEKWEVDFQLPDIEEEEN